MKKTCKECHKEFITSSSRRLYCYDQHFRTCIVCGKSFPVTIQQLHSNRLTCSETCRRKSIAETQGNDNKRKLFECTCTVCGKKFFSSVPNTKICNDEHTMICAVCKKPFVPTRQQLLYGKSTCSDECRYKLANQHYMENLDAHLANYKNTMLSRHGVDNPMKAPQFIEQAKATCIKRYGKPSFTQTSSYLDKCIQTNRVRYGVDWESQTKHHKDSVRATCLTRYGVTNGSCSKGGLAKLVSDPDKVNMLVEFKDDPESFIQNHFDAKPTLSEVAELCGIRDSSIGYILATKSLTHLVHYSYSKMEDQVFNFLKREVPDLKIVRNTRKVITPYELDLYLPDFNFAIECNPTATHNSTTCIFSENDSPKPYRYHQDKTDMCDRLGIQLFHIFGYEWSTKREILESMMLNKLGQSTDKLWARKTVIKEVTTNESRSFLDANHRQGYAHGTVRLGLYFNDELVSLMTFSRMRNTIGTSNNMSECWELVRFCNRLRTSVVGGASKLFQYFVHHYNPVEIRSFSDRAHTSGNLYSILGFHEIRRSDPGYVWVKYSTDVAYSRLNSQKRNLIEFLHDPDIDLSLSEREIMQSHGFVQVFDSGTITWQYKQESRSIV